MGTQKATNFTKKDNPIPGNILAAALSRGKLRVQCDNFTFAGESAGEVIKVGKLPNKAVLIAAIIHHAALGGSVTLSLGDSASATRYISGKSAASAGVLEVNDMEIGGVHYQQTADTEILLTTGGAAATGQVKTTLIYAEE